VRGSRRITATLSPSGCRKRGTAAGAPVVERWPDASQTLLARPPPVPESCHVPGSRPLQEIEISSRLYVENGARYMTANLMCAVDTESPRITPVIFILSGHRLVTMRYDMPKPFVLVENKLALMMMLPAAVGPYVFFKWKK
jgi:hypothetical protein